ncbi:MAG: major facilitator superfamily 1 [Thermoleophilia bacterium]|nr:major facilitator superfamily 1 [Thermoleophilia bacterium]
MDTTVATSPDTASRDPRVFRLFSRPVVAWAFYDFANTIFSFAVITRYFNEWVIDQQGRPDWHVGVMGFIVGLVLIAAMPALGAISDQLGRRLPFLAVFTTLCVLATVSLGMISSVTAALVMAGFAIFAFQLSLSMYDPLLATVAPPEHHGAVSGFGVGLGYVGVLIASILLTIIVPENDLQQAFLPTAILFAVFAVPIFIFVRERRPQRARTSSTGAIVRGALQQVVRTARHIRSDHRAAGRFLIARFLYVDATATVIAYMTVYMGRVGDFSKGDKTAVLGLAMVSAALSAFICGRLVERVGPKRVLSGILVLAATTLLIAAATGSPTLVWVLGPAIGATLGGVATSDRVFMMRLTPPELRGEFFGIYNLVGKLSSGIGPLVLWGGTIWLLHDQGSASVLDASRVALAMLALAAIAGLLMLRPLSDAPRFADDEWQVAEA